MPGVVEPTDERTNIVSSSLRRQKRLVRREDQSYVCLDAILVKPPDRFEPLPRHRAFDHDIGSQGGKIMPFPDHSLSLLTNHLKVYGSLNKSQNIRHEFDEFPVLFSDECRVGGYPVQDSHVDERLDGRYVGCVEKYLQSRLT